MPEVASRHRHRDHFGAAVAGVVGALGVLVVALLVGRVGSSADWAAWTQAIGTIAAVAVATWIAGRQSREAVEREHRASQARSLAASRLVSLLSVRLSAQLETWEEEAPNERRVSDLTVFQMSAARDRVALFPLASLDNPDAVFLVADALEMGNLSVRLAEELRDVFARNKEVGGRVMTDRLPVLREFVVSAARADHCLRDIAEPGWRDKVAPEPTAPL